MRFLYEDPSAEQTVLALHLLQCGLLHFPGNCLMMFIASSCLHSFFGDAGASKSDEFIDELKQRKPAFDVKFMVYSKERNEADQRKVANDYGGEQLQVLENAKYQNLDKLARQQHLLALHAIRDFWGAIKNKSPPANIVPVICRLSAHGHRADVCYQRLLAKFPNSKNILRTYAIFLTTIRAELAEAENLITIADEGIVEIAIKRIIKCWLYSRVKTANY